MHDLESDKETAVLLSGETYALISDGDFRRAACDVPKKPDGSLDYKAALTLVLESLSSSVLAFTALAFCEVLVERCLLQLFLVTL